MNTDSTGLSWHALQDRLRDATEAECDAMLKAELAGPARMRWLLRIQGRFNVLRAEREARELNEAWSARHGKQEESA